MSNYQPPTQTQYTVTGEKLIGCVGHDCDKCKTRDAELLRLKAKVEMASAIEAGDSVLMNEQATLLRECRTAISELINKKPTLAGLMCGTDTLGNLRARLYQYRPQGVFGSKT